MTIKRIVPAIIVAIIAALLLAGCGSDDSSDSSEDADDVDARTLLDQASDRLADTETVRFNLEVEGDTYIDEDETIRLLNARGDLERPNLVDVEFQVELLGAQNVSIRMITAGTESWTTNLLTGNWEPSPPEFGYNSSVLFDNQEGLGPVAGRLEHPTVEGSEEIGGRDTWRVSGTVNREEIAALTSGSIDGDIITVTLWLDQETNNMVRLEVDEPEIEGKENPATWTMSLTGHDADLDIQTPEVDA